jgi:hypothetical protein
MTLCNWMSCEPKLNLTAAPGHRGRIEANPLPLSVAERIAAFLDGRTYGEELLHELYDYVLEEPIPQRMRELLKQVELTEPDSPARAGRGRAVVRRRPLRPKS